MNKINWYLQKVIILLWVCIKLFFHSIFNTKRYFELFFAIFSSINSFYQSTFGGLLSFNDSDTFKKVKDAQVFANTNVFNVELEVARPLETQVLSSLASYFKPNKVFEIGTYTGFTTLHFALNTPSNSIVYTLDLPQNF